MAGPIPGTPKIGTLNEKPLHDALKRCYARPGDRFEVPVDGFVVDIVRGDLLIEVQTRNFSAIKRKLERLLIDHPVRLIYPIPRVKWITKRKLADGGDGPASRRRSPKHGGFEHVFEELIRLPGLLGHPNFSIELLLIEEEEVRRFDGARGWRRRGWVTDERRLLRVVDGRVFYTPADMRAFIPAALAEPFSVTDLATATDISRTLARKMVYCLRAMGCVAPAGKRANAILYARRG
ncbi:MAG TPA: hypothetical protein VLT35_02505 [Methanocella sp.]|nr:hypothetical protein [Methanocella sp.]